MATSPQSDTKNYCSKFLPVNNDQDSWYIVSHEAKKQQVHALQDHVATTVSNLNVRQL